jgi:hypothetical protein
MSKMAGLLFLLLAPAMAQAQQPTSQVLTFNGSIPGQDDGPVSLRLRLYDASNAGTLLFEETQTVNVSSEKFTVLIGNATGGGISPEVFQNSSIWVAFAPDATPDAEIGSRTPITSSGYAHFASFASNSAFSSFASNATNATNANTATTATNATRLGGVLADNYAQASERLRIVRGVFTQNGGIIVGSGFTVSHPATGQYRVTFTTAFQEAPAVTATADNGGIVGQYSIVSTAGVRYFEANFRTFRGNDTAFPVASNEAVHFIAIGRR